jgi:hypothetical protein
MALLYAWFMATKLIQELAETISESTPKIIHPIQRSELRQKSAPEADVFMLQ